MTMRGKARKKYSKKKEGMVAYFCHTFYTKHLFLNHFSFLFPLISSFTISNIFFSVAFHFISFLFQLALLMQLFFSIYFLNGLIFSSFIFLFIFLIMVLLLFSSFIFPLRQSLYLLNLFFFSVLLDFYFNLFTR